MITLLDSQLVVAYKEGNENALNILLERHQEKLFGYILTKVGDMDLANDVFQDTFVKAIITIKKGKYNEEGKFIQWIMRIAHNLIIDHFRMNKKVNIISETTYSNEDFNIFDIIASEINNIEDEVIQNQINKDILFLLEKLPEDQKEVIKLRIFSNLSFKEIAEETQVSINTALGRMRYAVINLRKLIEQHQVVLTN